MIKEKLIKLFKEWSSEEVVKVTPLPRSGSNREYYRLISANKSAIGVYNNDRKENLAFVEFSKSFKDAGLNVPEIYSEQLIDDIYLQEDLGEETLFQHISAIRERDGFNSEIDALFKKVLIELPKFQTKGSYAIDFSICYPRSDFDEQSMMWDLSYFKYYFIKLAGIGFDEQLLENDFKKLVEFLLTARRDYFMYRDFQTRNIMVKENEVSFIDYQGGRRGALQYDLASLLYDAKADIPEEKRLEYLDFYISELKNYTDVNADEFKSYYYLFVLIRIMQAMGAYGFRGFYEKKAHFLASIPFALNNLKFILSNIDFAIELPTLKPLLAEIANSSKLIEIATNQRKLKVSLNSFSYKRGIPVDETGNGGGFVFDCRALPNPGREEKYRSLTGKDLAVIDYLKDKTEVKDFLINIQKIVNQSVENYLERGFENLMINFGCTGGQHRSVFCAERVAKTIKDKFNVELKLRHREQEFKKLIMQAMIFAAGLGTRLYPLTKDKPKALVELNNISLLERAITKLIDFGVNRIIINSHHFSEKIYEFINNNIFKVEIIISHEKDLLETAGGLSLAKPYFKNEPIILYNADIVSNINISEFYNDFLNRNSIAHLAIRKRESDRVLLFDEDKNLRGWRNNRTKEEIITKNNLKLNEYAFSGIHIVSYEIFDYLKTEKLSLTPFYLKLCKTKEISAFDHTNDYWFDCGKAETLKEAETFLLKL